MFGFKTKKDRQLEELQRILAAKDAVLETRNSDIAELKEQTQQLLSAIRQYVDDVDDDSDESPVANDVPTSNKDYDGAYVRLVGTWDSERGGFEIDIDWNAPFLKHFIAMGVEGETEFEVAAQGVLAFARQVLETEQERRVAARSQIEKDL